MKHTNTKTRKPSISALTAFEYARKVATYDAGVERERSVPFDKLFPLQLPPICCIEDYSTGGIEAFFRGEDLGGVLMRRQLSVDSPAEFIMVTNDNVALWRIVPATATDALTATEIEILRQEESNRHAY